jgi:predicted O-methyltransferase YrrM
VAKRSGAARLRKAANRLSSAAYKRTRNSAQLNRMTAATDATTVALGRALTAILRDSFSPDELAWIRRIEALRAEVSASAQIVPMARKLPPAGGPPTLLRQRGQLDGTPAETAGKTGVTGVVGTICRNASKPKLWAALLFALVRRLRPAACLELGTCLGMSAAYQAAALELNGHGKMVTLEGIEALAALARQHFERLGLSRVEVVAGMFEDTLADVLDEISSVDFAFIDGRHNARATLEYYRAIAPFAGENAVLVFDDIRWSQGMEEAWQTIVADELVVTSLDLFSMGVCVLNGGAKAERASYRIALE